MNILFLDQSGKPGGAELSLLDVAGFFGDRCRVALFQDGPFRTMLEAKQIPVTVLDRTAIAVQKESGIGAMLGSVTGLLALVRSVAALSRQYDLMYANTPKALVVGALASAWSRRPFIYHLRDILSPEHFSRTNLRLAVGLANRFAACVIANSQATRDAFVAAGGNPKLATVVYNGFAPEQYQVDPSAAQQLRQQMGLGDRFVVGHFSRLSPWKGQHVLIQALADCPEQVVALLVGDALFGETEYVAQLHQQVAELGLGDRVKFLGFRSDVPQLMSACDLVAHTSTAPEPFGRVIVEAMLCGRPVVASDAGGAQELVQHGKTGWLIPPDNATKLTEIIHHCCTNPDPTRQVAMAGKSDAVQRFNLTRLEGSIREQIQQIG
jgi:glycosyltransferase involved in cell wall biosynthesis